MRWLLIDEFETIRKGEWAKGRRYVTRSEDAVAGVYPAVPLMPSSFLIEMMAQVAGVLVGATVDFKKEVVLAKVTDATFFRPVFAPAALEIEGRLLNLNDSAACCEGRVCDATGPLAKGVVFFGLFERLDPSLERSGVFSEDFMESYGIERAIESAESRSRDPETQETQV